MISSFRDHAVRSEEADGPFFVGVVLFDLIPDTSLNTLATRPYLF